MVPVNETLIKRITRTFFEEGTVEALNEAANIDSHQYNPIVGSLSRYLLALIGAGNRVKFFFKPHLKEQGVHCVGKYTQTKDWSKSAIRCIRWHPNCFKVAIAASDDSIRVYSDEPTIVPVLKSGLQKSVTSLAWRPLTAGELAVGCQNGTLVWNVDPNSLITRPLSQAIQLRYGNHFPVTSVEWSPNGCLLATASINDTDVLIWDVDQNRQVSYASGMSYIHGIHWIYMFHRFRCVEWAHRVPCWSGVQRDLGCVPLQCQTFSEFGKPTNGHPIVGRLIMEPFSQWCGLELDLIYCLLRPLIAFCIVWDLSKMKCSHLPWCLNRHCLLQTFRK